MTQIKLTFSEGESPTLIPTITEIKEWNKLIFFLNLNH